MLKCQLMIKTGRNRSIDRSIDRDNEWENTRDHNQWIWTVKLVAVFHFSGDTTRCFQMTRCSGFFYFDWHFQSRPFRHSLKNILFFSYFSFLFFPSLFTWLVLLFSSLEMGFNYNFFFKFLIFTIQIIN